MRVILLLIIALKASAVLSLDGLIAGTGITDENFSQIVPTSMEYAIADLALGENDGVVKAFYRIPSSSNLYSFTSKTKINLTNFDTREVLGNWPLKASKVCDGSEVDCQEPWWKGRWSEQEFLESEIIKRIISYGYNDRELYQFQLSYGDEEFENSVGCLEHTPLRYGDVDGDTKSELVLFLKDSLVIFSPQDEKVIFSMLHSVSDYVAWQTMIDAGLKLFSPSASSPQYGSKISYLEDQNAIPAYLSYGKLYVGDLDSDQSKDLIVWRKLYQSKLYGDSVQGFDKVRDTYLHYKKVDGEYQLQTDTTPETIQGWLTSKNLTWQSGFPSKSECAGQEGQLIPEMHDPLLNDPDVLK
jgi:hypothetical protein